MNLNLLVNISHLHKPNHLITLCFCQVIYNTLCAVIVGCQLRRRHPLSSSALRANAVREREMKSTF